MKKRIGNDIEFTWRIYRKSGEIRTAEDFEGKVVDVKLLSPLQREVEIEDVNISTGVVTFTFRGKVQRVLGAYTAVLYENDGADGMVTIDTVEAVTLVKHSFMEEDGDEGDVIEATSVELVSEITAGGGGGGVSVQADWAQDDATMADYIKNKPDLSNVARTDTWNTFTGFAVGNNSDTYAVMSLVPTTLTIAYRESSEEDSQVLSVWYGGISRTYYSNGERVTIPVVWGDDPRLTDARTPLSHTHAAADVTGLPAAIARLDSLATVAFSGSYDDLTDKPAIPDARMPIVAVESGASLIQAVAGTYYEVAGEVGTLSVALPVPEEGSKVSLVVVHLSVGASPNVVIGSVATVDYSASYEIKANKEYEINCMYNGDKWIVAGMEVV